MGYYLMRINRTSHVDILVKANCINDAEKYIDEWCTGRDNEDIQEIMAEREKDDTCVKNYFSTIEDYNRSHTIADFEVHMEEKEPRYDLYLIMDEEPCHVKRKVFQDVDMNILLWHLNNYNNDYILKRECPAWECAKESLKNGRSAIAYKCTKRKPKEYRIKTFSFKKEDEAHKVLNYLKDRIKEFGDVSVLDLYEVMNEPTEYTMARYGWKDLSDATVCSSTALGKIWIQLPTPVLLTDCIF